MALKKKSSGGGGANWMDTYGDMVTLLLCFFVLLYSMSTIDSAKWEALVMSFNPLAAKNMTETPKGGEGPSADADEGGVLPKPEETDPITQDITQDLAEGRVHVRAAVGEMDGDVVLPAGVHHRHDVLHQVLVEPQLQGGVGVV